MIELINIEFRYSKASALALDGISAQLQSGMYLLAGENGAGKTTLLHVISGVARPTSGECLINGTPSVSGKPSEMGRTFLLEENTFFPARSVREFARLHSPFYPNFSWERLDQNLEAFGLTGYERMKNLSLGNRKKTHLSYALALGVDVLLLDEPTNALDIQSKEMLRKLMASSLQDNQTVIVATHMVTELENLFDGSLMMNRSRLIYAGTTDAVVERLAFDVSSMPSPDALYTEIQAGRVLSVRPAKDNDPTRVDWRLLYSALQSPNRETVVRQLTKQ